MNRFPFDIVGFDLDGTLLDTHADLAAAVNHALALEGRPTIAALDVRALVGGGAKKMLARALEVTGGTLPDARFDELHAELLEYYEANISAHSRLFPGGEAMLDGLVAKGAKLAIVTNKLERFAVKLLGELGLAERFFTIIGGDTLGPGRAKPKPDLLLEMIARGGGGAASAAGAPCAVVSFGFCDLPPAEQGGTVVIDHFDELIPALEKL